MGQDGLNQTRPRYKGESNLDRPTPCGSSQRRAAQKREIGGVTARRRKMVAVGTVLPIAVHDMYEALGAADVEIYLESADSTPERSNRSEPLSASGVDGAETI
jgi:hypothetical protein